MRLFEYAEDRDYHPTGGKVSLKQIRALRFLAPRLGRRCFQIVPLFEVSCRRHCRPVPCLQDSQTSLTESMLCKIASYWRWDAGGEDGSSQASYLLSTLWNRRFQNGAVCPDLESGQSVIRPF